MIEPRSYGLLVVDEIGYLPLERQATNLLFALVARRYLLAKMKAPRVLERLEQTAARAREEGWPMRQLRARAARSVRARPITVLAR